MSNLSYIAPFFIVESLKDSLAFYTGKLGFEIYYTGPDDDPFYAMVGRDNISIMLKAITADVKPMPNYTRHEWARWDAYIGTKEPAALFEEYQSRGVTFSRPLEVDGDKLLGFEVVDVNGYTLFFGRPDL
jgi:catechol 2,3-dioxygenase-like lactoylglutathione lyase family enzyme